MFHSNDGELGKVLHMFYEQTAFPRPTRAPELDKLRSVVYKILERVRKLDARFNGDIEDVGSNASGSAAIVSCEFDILLRLKIAGFEEENKSPGFAKYRLADSSATLWKDANVNGYLQPRKVIGIFQNLIREAVSSMKLELGPEFSEFTIGGEGTVAIAISSSIRSFLKYKADVVLAVVCEGWPSSANAPWLQPGYSRQWPKRGIINDIKQNGYELVSKYVNEFTPGVNVEELDYLWRISMSRSETLLLQDIDDGGLCHKKLLVIMKAIRMYEMNSSTSGPPSYAQTPVVSSYHLKTMLFWESQTYPEAEKWSDDKLPERFRSFVANFDRYMSAKKLSNFFIPAVNLYRGYGGMGRLFAELCTDPITYMKSMKFNAFFHYDVSRVA